MSLDLIPGILWRLAFAVLLWYVARYALVPTRFATMIFEIEDKLDKPRDTFEHFNKHRILLTRACYLFSFIWLVLAGYYVYLNVRKLEVAKDTTKTRPYTRTGADSMPHPYGQPMPGATRPKGQ